MKKKRDKAIDFLRAFSIIGIILIHSISFYIEKNNNLLFYFSNYLHFVVISLVFCSGASYAYTKKKEDSWKFYIKRLKRLFIPWWSYLFLIHLPFNFIYDFIARQPFRYDTTYIFFSAIFFGAGGKGLPYGWILLLILITSIFSPLLWKLSRKKFVSYFLFFSFFLIGTVTFFPDYLKIIKFFPIHYILAFYLGVRYVRNNGKILSKYLLLSSGLLFAIVIFYRIIQKELIFQSTKFVPDLYFLSFSIFMTYLLLVVWRLGFLNTLYDFLFFISKNSLWIYLWHIVVLGFGSLFLRIVGLSHYNFAFLLEFGIVTTTCLIFVTGQNFLTRKIRQRSNKS